MSTNTHIRAAKIQMECIIPFDEFIKKYVRDSNNDRIRLGRIVNEFCFSHIIYGTGLSLS